MEVEALVSTALDLVCPRVVFSAEFLRFPARRGCVSGKQLENLRDDIRQGDSYDFDMIDGYDEIR